MIEHADFRSYHIPRTGGTTVEKFLLRYTPGCQRREPNRQLNHAPPIDVPVDRFSFAIIRRPDDWIRSLFCNAKRWDFGKTDPHKREQPESAWARKDFNEFVKAVMMGVRSRSWCSQNYSWYLIEPKLVLLPTEKLDAVFPDFCRENNIKINHEAWPEYNRCNVSEGKVPVWDKRLREEWLKHNWWALEQWEKVNAIYS